MGVGPYSFDASLMLLQKWLRHAGWFGFVPSKPTFLYVSRNDKETMMFG